MAVLLIDFEATGIDPRQARIIEIGAMVVDDQYQPIGKQVSQIVWESGYPALTDEVKNVTGITQDILLAEGVPLVDALTLLGNIVGPSVDFSIAFNKAYDEVLFKEEMARVGITTNGLALLFGMPWLCAMTGIETNYKFKSWRLAHLALEYGVTVNPKELHRAINDVELMRQMLIAAGSTPREIHAYEKIPWLYVQANTKPPWEDKGASTDMAKARGYNWQTAKGDPTGQVFDKKWVKRIKEKDLEKEEREAPFQVRRII